MGDQGIKKINESTPNFIEQVSSFTQAAERKEKNCTKYFYLNEKN